MLLTPLSLVYVVLRLRRGGYQLKIRCFHVVGVPVIPWHESSGVDVPALGGTSVSVLVGGLLPDVFCSAPNVFLL